MKKIKLFVLFLVLIFTFSITVYAESSDSELYVVNPVYEQQISEEELTQEFEEKTEDTVVSDEVMYSTYTSTLRDVIRNRMSNREEIIEVGYTNPSRDIEKVCEEIMNSVFAETKKSNEGDYLQWNCLGWKINIEKTPVEQTNLYKLTFQFLYRTTIDQEIQIENEIKNVQNELYGMQSLSDYQKIKYIYDYVSADRSMTSQMCATKMYKLGRELGLDIRIISGVIDEEFHVWNIVKINNYYYHVDASEIVERQIFLLGSNDWKWGEIYYDDLDKEELAKNSYEYKITVRIDGNGGLFKYKKNDETISAMGTSVYIAEDSTIEASGLSFLEDPEHTDNLEKEFFGWRLCVLQEYIDEKGNLTQQYVCTKEDEVLTTSEMVNYTIPECKEICFAAVWHGKMPLESKIEKNIQGNGGTFEISDGNNTQTESEYQIDVAEGMTFKEAGYSIGEDSIKSAQADQKFIGWLPCNSYLVVDEEGNEKQIFSSVEGNNLLTTDEMMEYVMPQENIMFFAQWKKSGTLDGVSIKILKDEFFYLGEAVEPQIIVQGANGNRISSDDFAVFYRENVTPGESYIIVCGIGDYKGTATEEFTIKLRAPSLGVNNDASSGKPKLTIGETEKADRYEIWRRKGTSGSYIKIDKVEKRTYQDVSAETGYKYYYKVKALYDADGSANSKMSSVVSKICKLEQPIITTSNEASSGKIKISWNKVDGAVKYRIYRRFVTAANSELIKTTSQTYYVDNNASEGSKYYYSVTAIAQDSSANSAISGEKLCLCRFESPNVKISNDAKTGKIKLKWQAISSVVNFKIYRSDSKNGSYKLIATKNSMTDTFVDKTAKAGKKYYYKMLTYYSKNTNANSTYSSVKSRMCDLERPQLTISLNSKGKPKVVWKKISGAQGYKVYRATAKNGKYSLVSTTKKLNYTDTKAKKGVTYFYKVIATHNDSNANSAFSTYVSKKSK